MTTGKHKKRIIRERMAATGESYTMAKAFIEAVTKEPKNGEREVVLPGAIHATTTKVKL